MTGAVRCCAGPAWLPAGTRARAEGPAGGSARRIRGPLPGPRAEFTPVDATVIPIDQSARTVADALSTDYPCDDTGECIALRRRGTSCLFPLLEAGGSV